MSKRYFKLVDEKLMKHPYGVHNLPKRATENSAAYDFTSPIGTVINPGENVLIWTDVCAHMQHDEVLLIDVRSSMGMNRIMLSNTLGVIDSDYENATNGGNIGINLYNFGKYSYEIKPGDKIAQGMFTKYLTCGDRPTNKRTGGHGSTGTN